MRIALNCLCAVLLLASCDENRVFEDNTPVDGDGWSQKQAIAFDVTVDDTLSGNNFYVNLRHGDNYPFSNLYLFMKTDFPNGKSAQDTLELVLQNPDGKWTGKGFGDVFDHQIMFKRNLRFPLKGKYRFSLMQAMQMPVLTDVKEVGLRIEKFQQE